MTADELSTAITVADAKDEMWSLLVEHADAPVGRPRFELHAWNFDAFGVFGPELVSGLVRECLLSRTPVPCNVAAAVPIIDLLNGCTRCDHA